MDEYIPSTKEEFVAKKIVDVAYNVHKNIDPVLPDLTINFNLSFFRFF